MSRALVTACVAALCPAAVLAGTAEPEYGRLSGRLWFVGREYRALGAPPDAVPIRPVDEYLSVAWADVGVRGLGMDLLMRGRGDWRQEGGADDEVEVMSARIAWRGLRPGLDLALGRQFLSWGSGYYNFDGLRLDWRAPRGWGFLAFAGTPLGYQEHSAPRGEGRTLGAGVSYERAFVERYVLMAERQTLDGDVSRQRLSLDARRLFGARLSAYGSADYNDGLGCLGDVLAGARVRLSRRLRAGAEWLRYVPDFPLESIFNFFPVEPFNETRVELGHEGRQGSGAWLRVGRQRFERAAPRERDRRFAELTVRPRRAGAWWIEGALFQISGYGGDRRGARLGFGGALPWRGLSIRGGADLYDFRNPFRLVEREETVSAWGRLEWTAARGWNAWIEGRQHWSVLGRRDFEAAAGGGLRFGGRT